MPKEMLPILDKPLIQYGVEEAVAAGLTEIAFVTGRGKRAIEDHFDNNYELDQHLRGKDEEAAMAEIRRLIEVCSIAYTRQLDPLGPGHAILTAQQIVGDEPFAVVLSDDLCFGTDEGVLSQMVSLYCKYHCCVVAVQEVAPELTDRYGIVDADRQEDGSLRVKSLVEKPSPNEAPSAMAIVGRYILVPQIFDDLQSIRPGFGGELQITDALNERARKDQVIACEFNGIRFDCGSVEGFVEATNHCFRERFDSN